jgi:uncharacterized membrane protein (DUF2068 family)
MTGRQAVSGHDAATMSGVPRALRGIAIFKFTKAFLLTLLGGSLWALDDPATLQRLVHVLAPFAAGHHLIAGWFGSLPAAVGGHWHVVAVSVCAYALVFLVEGIGLWRGRRWGAWLTVAVSASLIPLELYEWCVHATVMRSVVLLINVAIVAYLWRLLHRRRRAAAASPDAYS